MKLCRLALLAALLLALAVQATAAEAAAENRGRPLLKSLLWPGLGQIEQGRTGRGALWAGGAVVLAAGTFYAHQHYHDIAQDFENAEDSYHAALADGDGDAAWSHFQAMQIYHPKAEDRLDTRNLIIGALVVYWAANLVDTWLFDRGGDAPAGDTAALPGRLAPVVRRGAAGVAWTVDF
ncbi:MAG: hypothetical protein JW819_12045 [Candidatus Krumholzibacteriota bacterium]|nr:hypothetical protein [Candidatus Krumholzibacteriota bacterium]